MTSEERWREGVSRVTPESDAQILPEAKLLFQCLLFQVLIELFSSMMNKDYGYGGMISIDMGTSERANRFMELMQREGVGYLAVSLCYFKALFSNSGKSTSSEVPEDVQRQMGMSEGLVRFSVGLDADIEHAFEKIRHCLGILESN